MTSANAAKIQRMRLPPCMTFDSYEMAAGASFLMEYIPKEQMKRLEKCVFSWDISSMITAKADNRRRVQIPNIKSGTVFSIENDGAGTIVLHELKPVKADKRQPTARLKKENGRTVVVPDQPINMDAIKEMISEFP